MTTPKKDELFTWYCAPGQPFGVYSVFSEGPRWTSVIAEEDCEVNIIDKEAFLFLLKHSHQAIEMFVKEASAVIRQENTSKINNVTHNNTQRLAKFLLEQYRNNFYGEFSLPKLKDLADFLNMSQTDLNRKLTHFEENDYITRKNKLILKLDNKRLEADLLQL